MAEMQQPVDKPDFDNVWSMFKETERRFRETDLKFKETDLKFQETDRMFKETDKKLNKLEYLFTSQWGKLIESLVDGDLIRLLNERNITVNYTTTRTKLSFNNRQYEFDIIAENSNEVVIVEVKTTMKVNDVREFLAEMKHIREIFPKYRDYNIYGAIAYLVSDEKSEILASRNGLFTIRATGNSATVTNPETFKPKKF